MCKCAGEERDLIAQIRLKNVAKEVISSVFFLSTVNCQLSTVNCQLPSKMQQLAQAFFFIAFFFFRTFSFFTRPLPFTLPFFLFATVPDKFVAQGKIIPERKVERIGTFQLAVA